MRHFLRIKASLHRLPSLQLGMDTREREREIELGCPERVPLRIEETRLFCFSLKPSFLLPVTICTEYDGWRLKTKREN